MTSLAKNGHSVLNHIKALAFNRRASSLGEIEAINYIQNELNSEFITTEREYFTWKSHLALLIRLGYLLIFLNLIIFRQILIITLYFVIKNFFHTTRTLSLLPQESSKNLFAYMRSENKVQNKPILIFSSHYDSISAMILYKFQKIIFIFYKILAIFYGGFISYFFINFFFQFLSPFENLDNFITFNIFLSIFGIFVSAPLILLVLIEIDSAGSIDNASGVSINIELAKNFNKKSLKNIDLLFLWTGAEEEGLKGSKRFCKNHFELLNEKYDLRKSCIINIDMVGSYIGLLDKIGPLCKKINKNLNSIIQSSADQLDIEIETFSQLFNVNSDHKSFKKFRRKTKGKFQIACIHSHRDEKYIHSSKDIPSRCSSEVLANCVSLLIDVINKIDKTFEH